MPSGEGVTPSRPAGDVCNARDLGGEKLLGLKNDHVFSIQRRLGFGLKKVNGKLRFSQNAKRFTVENKGLIKVL